MNNKTKDIPQSEQLRFSLFCIEVAQAGIALNTQDLQTVYNAARKLEGFSDEDFERQGNVASDYIEQAKKSITSVSKYKQVADAIAFNTIVKQSINDLDKKEDLIEYVGKVKRLAAIMAEEFLEPDEKLEKVAEDGRRLIVHFIEQWKKLPPKEEPQYQGEEIVEEIKDENLQ